MDTKEPDLYVRRPHVKISPEELKKRNERLLATLKSFREDYDEEEMKETGRVLMAALAEARESNREPEGDLAMDAATKEPTLYERRRRVKISPEQLKKRNAELKALLQKFVDEGDEEEQKETGTMLMKALAEARESNREPGV